MTSLTLEPGDVIAQPGSAATTASPWSKVVIATSVGGACAVFTAFLVFGILACRRWLRLRQATRRRQTSRRSFTPTTVSTFQTGTSHSSHNALSPTVLSTPVDDLSLPLPPSRPVSHGGVVTSSRDQLCNALWSPRQVSADWEHDSTRMPSRQLTDGASAAARSPAFESPPFFVMPGQDSGPPAHGSADFESNFSAWQPQPGPACMLNRTRNDSYNAPTTGTRHSPPAHLSAASDTVDCTHRQPNFGDRTSSVDPEPCPLRDGPFQSAAGSGVFRPDWSRFLESVNRETVVRRPAVRVSAVVRDGFEHDSTELEPVGSREHNTWELMIQPQNHRRPSDIGEFYFNDPDPVWLPQESVVRQSVRVNNNNVGVPTEKLRGAEYCRDSKHWNADRLVNYRQT